MRSARRVRMGWTAVCGNCTYKHLASEITHMMFFSSAYIQILTVLSHTTGHFTTVFSKSPHARSAKWHWSFNLHHINPGTQGTSCTLKCSSTCRLHKGDVLAWKWFQQKLLSTWPFHSSMRHYTTRNLIGHLTFQPEKVTYSLKFIWGRCEEWTATCKATCTMDWNGKSPVH